MSDSMRSGQWWFRAPRLVEALLGVLAERGEMTLPALVDVGMSVERGEGRPYSEKAVAGAVGELQSFGVLVKLGTAGRGQGDRRVRLTVLGRAWLVGVEWPGLGSSREDHLAAVARVEECEDADGEGFSSAVVAWLDGAGLVGAVEREVVGELLEEFGVECSRDVPGEALSVAMGDVAAEFGVDVAAVDALFWRVVEACPRPVERRQRLSDE